MSRFLVLVWLLVWPLSGAVAQDDAPAVLAPPSASVLQAIRPQMRPAPVVSALSAARAGEWDRAAELAAGQGRTVSDIIEWMRLQAGRGSYAELAGFLTAHPDWPRLGAMQIANEKAIVAAGDTVILERFAGQPATTAEAVLAHARALHANGESKAAEQVVLNAWRTINLEDTDRALFLAEHEAFLKPRMADRLDAMLWKGWTQNASAILSLVPDDQAALARARIALQRRSGDVDARLEEVPDALQSDPGLLRDRFEWRVRKGRWAKAKQMLLDQSVSPEKLGQPSAWAGRRRVLARDELRDGSAKRAYQMAARHHLTGGSDYADLEWLAGYIALTRLNDPEQALLHFENHDSAVASPISQGRAGYWKGRAHRAAGNVAAADMEFARGAAYQSSFYGLLAAEEADLPFDVGLSEAPQEDWRESPLAVDSVFLAGRLLAQNGERDLAELFWTHLAAQLGDNDAALLGQAAIDLEEPHLAVMIGKTIARRGVIAPKPYYPLHPLAEADLPVPAELALAIARRESEFDPVVVSGAGAQGLMQLMPATAREVSGKLGLLTEHSTARLTTDPVYNARLGTAYLQELIDRFDGNIIMVAAAYNAGPSRPERWISLYGDPRGKGTEALVDWIENIPFRETRNYVMRVSESLPIFRARLGRDPLPQKFSVEIEGSSLR